MVVWCFHLSLSDAIWVVNVYDLFVSLKTEFLELLGVFHEFLGAEITI